MINEKDRWKKGKSYKKYCYTVKDIADLSGKAIQTVRNDIHNKVFDPKNVESVMTYIRRQHEKGLGS